MGPSNHPAGFFSRSALAWGSGYRLTVGSCFRVLYLLLFSTDQIHTTVDHPSISRALHNWHRILLVRWGVRFGRWDTGNLGVAYGTRSEIPRTSATPRLRPSGLAPAFPHAAGLPGRSLRGLLPWTGRRDPGPRGVTLSRNAGVTLSSTVAAAPRGDPGSIDRRRLGVTLSSSPGVTLSCRPPPATLSSVPRQSRDPGLRFSQLACRKRVWMCSLTP